jgi:hypothetical protein
MPNIKTVIVESALTSRLGQIIIRWSEIEEWLSKLLGTMAEADLGAMSVITSTAGAASEIQWIKTIIDVFEYKDPRLNEIRELVNRVDELRIDGMHSLTAHGIHMDARKGPA